MLSSLIEKLNHIQNYLGSLLRLPCRHMPMGPMAATDSDMLIHCFPVSKYIITPQLLTNHLHSAHQLPRTTCFPHHPSKSSQRSITQNRLQRTSVSNVMGPQALAKLFAFVRSSSSHFLTLRIDSTTP